MIRAIVATALLASVTVAALSRVPTGDPGVTGADPIPTTVYTADASVRPHRLPWLAGAERTFNQGWLGVYSHDGQYATDWGNGGATFEIYAASEGDTTCYRNIPGWGTFIDIQRSGGKVERYAHLQLDCPVSLPAHVEQGQAIAWADNTGCRETGCGIHLHYEVFYVTTSVPSALSNFGSLSDTLYHPWPHYPPGHPHNTFVADNAGPGVGIGIPAWGTGAMSNEYKQWGHFFCSGNAWNCMGSSARFYGDLVKATPLTLRGEDGWHQDFNGGSLGWTGIDWPSEANCGVAYWMPSNVWSKWMQRINDLGHLRSSMTYFSGPIPGVPPNQPGWYQFFANGHIFSYSYNSSPNFVYTGWAWGCGP